MIIIIAVVVVIAAVTINTPNRDKIAVNATFTELHFNI